jgi:hypothetical protein
MSTAKDQFNVLVTENAQQARVIEARAKLQNCAWTVQETNASIQALVDEGALNLISTELKVALNAMWTVFKQAEAAIAALAAKDVLEA